MWPLRFSKQSEGIITGWERSANNHIFWYPMRVLEYGNYLKLRSLWRQKCNNFTASRCLTPYKLKWILAWTCDNEDFCWNKNIQSLGVRVKPKTTYWHLFSRDPFKSLQGIYFHWNLLQDMYQYTNMIWWQCLEPMQSVLHQVEPMWGKKMWNWVLSGTMPI